MPLLLLSTLMMVVAEGQPARGGSPSPSDSKIARQAAADGAEQLRDKLRDKLRDDVRAGLRATRGSATSPPSEEAARRLLDVYGRLVDDDQLRSVDRLRLLRTVRSRLARVAELLRQDLRRRGRDVPDTDTRQPAQVELPMDRANVLAQQQVGPPRGVAGQQPAGAARAQRGFSADYGQDLVDLIEETIAAPSWDTNGGPGAIHYYRPLRVLVIRQTSEVHGRVGGVLNQMRRN